MRRLITLNWTHAFFLICLFIKLKCSAIRTLIATFLAFLQAAIALWIFCWLDLSIASGSTLIMVFRIDWRIYSAVANIWWYLDIFTCGISICLTDMAASVFLNDFTFSTILVNARSLIFSSCHVSLTSLALSIFGYDFIVWASRQLAFGLENVNRMVWFTWLTSAIFQNLVALVAQRSLTHILD